MSSETTTEQTEDFWVNHSRTWRSSGLKQAEYCEQAGISYQRFIYQHHWILTKERRTDVNFIQVKSERNSATAPSAGIQLMLPNGVRVGIANELSPELLKTVLTIACGLAC